MNHYAPEYTKRERLLAVAKTTAWAIPLFGLTQFWFLPKFSEYAENAHCYVYGDITGLHLVMYFVFVAVPLLPATFLAILEGPRAIRVIKAGQYPLPGEKVYLKTKYVYGTRARLRSYILLATVVLFVGLSVKGIQSANEIVRRAADNPPACTSS